MLVELFDLKSSPEGGENWAETGRWIKYEEDVEGVNKHWGRPHVAFLAFHALKQLRQCFVNGILLFDLRVSDMAAIVAKLTSAMVTEHGMDSETADALFNTLKVDRFRKNSSKSHSSKRSQRRDSNSSKGYSNPIGPTNDNPDNDHPQRRRKSSIAESVQSSWGHRHDDIVGGAMGANFASRDPEAELCQVYAGVMPALKALRFFMVRLVDPIFMPDLRSSVLPLRFLFIVAGPPVVDVDYHELGRSIATLMADTSFKKLAFSATRREQLVKGIDNFLDFSIVIPPSDIDSHDLLTAEDVQKAIENRRQLRSKSMALVSEKPEVNFEEVMQEKKSDIEFSQGLQPSRVDHVVDALRRTGRPFGGVVEDIKYRAPYYVKDFRDALHFKTITATLFMFFANFASAVAFGEVMEDKTDGYMGATEMLMAHAVCGVVWGFISCQPLCIQAAVGPFLVLEASLYALCKGQGLDFLAVRWWTGLWTFVLMLLTALVEGPFLVRYLTRFTEDIFTSLIAFIFIWEAGKYMYKEIALHPLHALSVYCGYYQQSKGNSSLNSSLVYLDERNFTEGGFISEALNGIVDRADDGTPLSPTQLANQPNTALLSFILVVFTFLLAFTLKRLGTSAYFGRTIKKTLSDFGVPLSVLIVIMIYQLCFRDTHIRHVESTLYFSLTNASLREWVVKPMGDSNPLPVWAIFIAIVPAIFVGILTYAEVEIIELLLAKKDRGLKRPHGFHWDLIVCGAMIFVCGVFGMPWMCPGAVQSLSHANALQVFKRTAPGAAPQLDYVVEQRVSCMLVGILHGAAAFAGVVLVLIPVPVLFGLFLLLGVMGLVGIQFVHRLTLLFVPQKYFPDVPYCKEVSWRKMHLFTLIQFLCFAVLWAVNMIQSVALAFPFILALIAVFRMFFMRYFFKPEELQALDGKPEEKRVEPQNKDHDHNDALSG